VVATQTTSRHGSDPLVHPAEPGRPAPPEGVLHGISPRLLGLVALLVLLVLAVAGSIAFGTKPIPLGTAWDALTHHDSSLEAHVIIVDMRIPRTYLGLLVGIALGMAGALMQGITRNPLADPGILGVDAGAALCVVIGIYVFGFDEPLQFVWFAFLGAAIASVVVYGLGSIGREGATPVKLALAGAALTALLASMTSAVLIIDLATLDQFRFWAVGSLAGRGWDISLPMTPFILAGTFIALVSGFLLNPLSLGDDMARNLGQRIAAVRAFATLGVVLLCGAATAAAGPIVFVGLVVPHIARAIVGPDHRWIVPYSALIGAVLLLVADTVGRVIARPGEVQVGIMTALIGAPFFIAFVRRRKLAEV
jgi:iron complex transport system permease protein